MLHVNKDPEPIFPLTGHHSKFNNLRSDVTTTIKLIHDYLSNLTQTFA